MKMETETHCCTHTVHFSKRFIPPNTFNFQTVTRNQTPEFLNGNARAASRFNEPFCIWFQITQLKIASNPFAKGFRDCDPEDWWAFTLKRQPAWRVHARAKLKTHVQAEIRYISRCSVVNQVSLTNCREVCDCQKWSRPTWLVLSDIWRTRCKHASCYRSKWSFLGFWLQQLGQRCVNKHTRTPFQTRGRASYFIHFKGVNALHAHRTKPLEAHIHQLNVELRNCAPGVHE